MNGRVRPVEIYLNTPPPDPAVARPVRLSRVTFADLAEPQSQNVAGTLFGGVLLGFIDRDPETLRIEYARQLRQNVREGLDPPVEPIFEWIPHGPHHVLCVLVPRGDDQPYHVIETGEFMLRSNATSRHMRPAELDEAFNRRRQRFG